VPVDSQYADTTRRTSYTYAIYYSFFEAFPLVYPKMYGFNLGETGLTFLAIGPATMIAVAAFIIYQRYLLVPDVMRNGLKPPEHFLLPALLGVIIVPPGLFKFAWTARYDIHWIVSLIALSIFVIGQFWVFQSIFVYLPLSYPKYAASMFSANDMSRSMLAAGTVEFSHPVGK
jgi:MFS transporter, DHA1 family, multidrug resistance protein